MGAFAGAEFARPLDAVALRMNVARPKAQFAILRPAITPVNFLPIDLSNDGMSTVNAKLEILDVDFNGGWRAASEKGSTRGALQPVPD